MEFPLSVGPPPPLIDIICIHFVPYFFFLSQLNLSYMKRILHLIPVKIIILKSSYNCFKIDILRLVRSLTAIFSAVQSQGIGKIVSLQLSGKVLAIQIFAGYKLQDWGSSGRQQLSTKRDNCPNASLMVQLLMVENSNTLPWLKEMVINT